MRIVFYLLFKLIFGPTLFCSLPKVPVPLLFTQISIEDHHVLCPADLHRKFEQFRSFFVGPVKLTHPAHIARRETSAPRILLLQVFGGGNRSTFFCPGADSTAKLSVHLHLRQIFGNDAI